MKFRPGAIAGVSLLLLAGCGGGGGSSGSGGEGVGGSTQPVVITQGNAKPLAANALDTAQNMSAAQAGQLVTGVQVDVPGLGSGPLAYAQAAIAMTRRVAPAKAPDLAVGVSINQTVACSQGGSVTVTGNVASSNGLSVGDNVTLVASACKETVGGVTTTTSGRMSIAVNSGSVTGALPYRVVMDVTLADFSVQSGTLTSLGSGDMRMDLAVSGTGAETLTVSGTSLSSRITGGPTVRGTTLKNYSQTLTTSGTTASSVVTGTVVADSSRLGTSPVSYTISTPTPVSWNTSSGVVSAGAVKVVGANNAQLLVTVGASSTVTIQLDANGDGSYEASIGSSVGELTGLL